MIVNYTNGGWQIITQRAHGILAAQLAMQWAMDNRPKRWTETVLAIAEHDDAEIELDGENLLTEQGGPLNYSMKTFELAHCERLYRDSLTKSQYIALLTSMHMNFLYNNEESKNPVAKKFLTEQRKLQTAWRRNLEIDKKTADEIYSQLQWCDACSLLICQQQFPPDQRKVDISAVAGGSMNQLVQLNEEQLTIDPWPFEPKAFTISLEFRFIKQLQFRSSKEFREAFVNAKVSEKEWTVKTV